MLPRRRSRARPAGAHRCARAVRSIPLQPREFRLLEYLMKHAGQVVTRTMLLENVWDYHFDPQTNVIDVHISRLRAKIDKGFPAPLLHTVRGAGYMISDAVREGRPHHGFQTFGDLYRRLLGLLLFFVLYIAYSTPTCCSTSQLRDTIAAELRAGRPDRRWLAGGGRRDRAARPPARRQPLSRHRHFRAHPRRQRPSGAEPPHRSGMEPVDRALRTHAADGRTTAMVQVLRRQGGFRISSAATSASASSSVRSSAGR